MKKIQPIIYTRPFARNLDYCYFARPVMIHPESQVAKDIEMKFRNVCAVERHGDIIGDRWHVLRIGDNILVGIATERFARCDFYGRHLRGYYGFLMHKDYSLLPFNIEFFQNLDADFVVPLFEAAEAFSPFLCDDLTKEIYTQDNMFLPASNSEEGFFNVDQGVVRIFPEEFLQKTKWVLQAALAEAQRSSNFELIIGLNSKSHAIEKPVNNAVCYGQAKIENIRINVESAQNEHGKFNQIASIANVDNGDSSNSREKSKVNSSNSVRKKQTRLFLDIPCHEKTIVSNVVSVIKYLLMKIFGLEAIVTIEPSEQSDLPPTKTQYGQGMKSKASKTNSSQENDKGIPSSSQDGKRNASTQDKETPVKPKYGFGMRKK